MAKLPPFKRFSLEDFQDQRGWIEKLISPLNEFTTRVTGALVNGLTHSENVQAQIGLIKVQTSASLTQGTAYATTVFKTFIDANVNTGTEVLTITTHGFSTGDRVQLSTTGALPTGLSSLTDYYVISTGASTLQLSATLSGAFAASAVNITAAAGGGTHTVTKWAQMPAYAGLFEIPQLKVTMAVKPVGLVIWNVVEIATNPSVVVYAVTADWTYSNGQVFLNAVSGLLPSKSYQLTVALYGG